MPVQDSLRDVHLFAPLNAEQTERMRENSREVRLEPGQTLFTRGEPAHRFFVVIEGTLKLSLLSRSGEEKIVNIVEPGQTFAEAVMFMNPAGYPVNASALTEARLVAFENRAFLSLLEKSPALMLELLATMSQRLHGLVREIDELTLHNATYRLVTYLLGHERADTHGVRLSIQKQVIASRLSIKPETLSRILARLREQGLVKVSGEHITLLDEDGLRGELER